MTSAGNKKKNSKINQEVIEEQFYECFMGFCLKYVCETIKEK